MNYTEIYNKIYKSLDKKNLNHDDKHAASLKITNAVWDLYINTSDNYPETFTTISNLFEMLHLEEISSKLQATGGHDLDDRD
jgi:hypothetical protein